MCNIVVELVWCITQFSINMKCTKTGTCLYLKISNKMTKTMHQVKNNLKINNKKKLIQQCISVNRKQLSPFSESLSDSNTVR